MILVCQVSEETVVPMVKEEWLVNKAKMVFLVATVEKVFLVLKECKANKDLTGPLVEMAKMADLDPLAKKAPKEPRVLLENLAQMDLME